VKIGPEFSGPLIAQVAPLAGAEDRLERTVRERLTTLKVTDS
jgi:hypothetical protein